MNSHTEALIDGANSLDPTDPFDAALIEMAQLHRKKRADYAADSNRWSNFETTASLLGLSGFGTQEAIEVNIAQKMARLQSLRANGRIDDPQNESVLDTYRDRAVYSVLALVYATTFLVPGVGRCAARYVLHFLDFICFVGFFKACLNPQGRSFADALTSCVVIQDGQFDLMTAEDYRQLRLCSLTRKGLFSCRGGPLRCAGGGACPIVGSSITAS